ncbi:SGNH/GDSL hydrolase family protein [Bosea beijingensis]|uniref:SGNH/GDSL hydrolase family protein n=1 Tax=Bosea beijingensis TaxID=3068632 RepID=UPI0027419C27|nr:GDSL-type esterase/lipase family protein [Bosea sp. REN20]
MPPPPDTRCRAEAAKAAFQPSLPAARKALQETGRLTVVALGSSATAGSGASADDKSYPSVLQAELRRRLPGAEVRVVNKGVGGQSAYDMLLRMQADVIDEKPAIVIWQTVINDAIRDIGEDKLGKILRKGVGKARGAGIEMILMDLPWLPREGRYPHYDDYRAVLTKTAQDQGISLFPRYAMMKGWSNSRQFTPEELVGMDGLHLVDAGYRCLALRLADGIVAGIGPVRIETAGKGARPTN